MTAPVNNGVPHRPTETYHYGNDNTGLEVHEVTDDTKGEVMTVAGPRTVQPGEFLVATERPDMWNVYSKDAFGELGASKGDSDDVPGDVEDDPDFTDLDDDDNDEFDPNTRNAAEVKAYLARSDVSDSEKARVREAERSGQNRQSALR